MNGKKGNIFVLGIVSMLIVAGLMISAKSSASAVEAMVSGQGSIRVENDSQGKNTKRNFSVSARIGKDGGVKGRAQLQNPSFTGGNEKRYAAQIDISCMKVYGNTVVFGGSVKRTNDPNLTDSVFFAVRDNGEPGKGKDEISFVYFDDDIPGNNSVDPSACENTPTDFFQYMTIESGNIQVKSK